MTTSKKILIVVFVAIIGFVLIHLFVVRQYLKEVVATSDRVTRYESVDVTDFSKILIESGYQVRINQSREISVEVETGTNKELIQIGERQLTLASNESAIVNVRIFLPMIESLSVEGNSKVRLAEFTQDSLFVVIKDNVVFTSADNKIIELEVQPYGQAKVIIKDDPMK